MTDQTKHNERDSSRFAKRLLTKSSFALPFDEAQPTPSTYNLPHLLTELVGRETECNQLRQLLEKERLITVVGPGGVGKTHLAVSVARQNLCFFPYGVYWVALAPVTEPTALIFTIADTLEFSFYSPFDTKQQLLNYLADKKLLLLMDNFEHLLAGANLLADILQAAPQVQILATSRQRLGLRGEVVFDLQGLACPPGNETCSAIENYAAVQLFLQSARRSQSAFSLSSDGDCQCVSRICQLVDGLPLALDIAAAWARLLPLHEIAAEVERGLDFLTSPWRDAPERQRSLRAVLDYSWQMLLPAEREVLANLAVFQGNFTRRAAEQVAGVDLAKLSSLVEKSFLRWDLAAERYSLHPLVEQYAAEKLAAQPDAAERAYEKHARYFADFLAHQWENLQGAGQKAALQQIVIEWGNARRAWAWALQQSQWRLLEGSMNSLCRFYKVHGPLQSGLDFISEAIHRMQTVADVSVEKDKILAKLKVRQAEFLASLSDPKARELALECLQTSQQLALARETIGCLSLLSGLELQRGEYDLSYQYREQALRLARQEGLPDLEAASLNGLGMLCLMRRQLDEAKVYLEDALSISRQIGNTVQEAVQRANLSQVVLLQKDYDRARSLGERAIQLVREAGDRSWEAGLLYTMGDAQFRQGNYQLSDAYYQQAQQIFSDLGNRKWEMILLLRLGKNARVLGSFDAAQAYFDQVAHLQAHTPDQQAEVFWLDNLGIFYRLLGEYHQAEAFEMRALQLARSAGERYVEVLALTHLSQVSRDMGNLEIGISYANEVQVLAQKLGDFQSQAEAWCAIGDIHTASQSFADATSAYQSALDFGRKTGDVLLIIMALAGLAGVTLAQGSASQALEQVEQILDHLSDGGLTRVEEPIKVYWTCYRVLVANRDPRAEELLCEGYRLLQERAAKITDERLRHLFLENVPAHCDFFIEYTRQEKRMHRPLAQAENDLIEMLSERELEVLRLIANGLTSQQICDTLYISLNTVKTHSRHIFRKLGVSSRTQAIRYVHENGL